MRRHSRRSARSPAWRASSRRSRPPTRWLGCWPRRTVSSTSCAFRAGATRTLPASAATQPRELDTAMSAVQPAGQAQRSGIERIGAAFAGRRGRAALMPYVMAGYPTLAESIAIGEACAQAGADVIELGMPYSDPLADGPVIHAAGTAALA